MTGRKSKAPGPRVANDSGRPASQVQDRLANATVYEAVMEVLVRYIGGRLAFSTMNAVLMDCELFSPETLTRVELSRLIEALRPRVRPLGTLEEVASIERELAGIVGAAQRPLPGGSTNPRIPR